LIDDDIKITKQNLSVPQALLFDKFNVTASHDVNALCVQRFSVKFQFI